MVLRRLALWAFVLLSSTHSFAASMVVKQALDARSESLCKDESAFGNLVADAARKAASADVALFDCQSFDSVGVFDTGAGVTTQDVLGLLGSAPIHIDIQQINGAELLQRLENLVSGANAPHISGIRIVVDALQQPGMRISKITVAGEALQFDRTYRIATAAPPGIELGFAMTLQDALKLELQNSGLLRARTYGRIKRNK